MKHPIEQMNINQKKFLEDLPEGERKFHERLFRIGNASYCYHTGAESLEPTQEDFNEWIKGLPVEFRGGFIKRGFDDCRGVLSFTRYVNEKNDIGMDQWMKEHLSNDDYHEYEKGNAKK